MTIYIRLITDQDLTPYLFFSLMQRGIIESEILQKEHDCRKSVTWLLPLDQPSRSYRIALNRPFDLLCTSVLIVAGHPAADHGVAASVCSTVVQISILS